MRLNHQLKFGIVFAYICLTLFSAKADQITISEAPADFCGTARLALDSIKLNEPLARQGAGLNLPPADAGFESTTLEMLILYTPAALNGAGGEEAIKQLIEANVNALNYSFHFSKVNVAVRPVHIGLISYIDSGNIFLDGERLVKGEGALSRAHSLRNDFKADLVCLIIEHEGGGAGGYALDIAGKTGDPNRAYMALRRPMLKYPLVFAHEVGHLLGCEHHREDFRGRPLNDVFYRERFPYIFGNRWTVEGVTYADIMCYPPGIHAHLFGNPEVKMDGVPTGADESSPEPASTARVINQVAPYAARYRTVVSRMGFSSDRDSRSNKDAEVKVLITREGNLQSTSSVMVAVAPTSTARAGVDYAAPSARTVTFATNQSHGWFTIQLLHSDERKPVRKIDLVLTTPSAGHGIGWYNSQTLSLNDNRFVTLRSGDEKSEKSGAASVSAQYTGHFDEETGAGPSVAWHTLDGSAQAGSDYQAVSGTINFLRGESYVNISIPILDDDVAEPDEEFHVVVDGVTNTIRLRDDDGVGRIVGIPGENVRWINTFNLPAGLNVAIRGEGKLLVWGHFNAVSDGKGYVSQPGLSLVQKDGLLDDSFQAPEFMAGHRFTHWFNGDPPLDPPLIYTVLPLPDGDLLVGGQFSLVGGEQHRNLVRLNRDGSIHKENYANPQTSGAIYALALQPDGKFIAAGFFKKVHGVAEEYGQVARFLNNGEIDRGFKAQQITVNGRPGNVSSVVVLEDGKILIAGAFNKINETSSASIARLNSDGTLDASFNIGGGANGRANRVAFQPDGKIVLAGHFTEFNGRSTPRIVRLHANGSIDNSFKSPNPNQEINHLALLPDGRIIIGGLFTSIGPDKQRFLALLKKDGSLDKTVALGNGPSSELGNDLIMSFGDQGTGQALAIHQIGTNVTMYVAGAFREFNGLPADGLVALRMDEVSPAFGPIRLDETKKPVTTLHGIPGSLYRIERSEDLNSWREVMEVQFNDEPNVTMNLDNAEQRGFFRAVNPNGAP